MADFQKGDRIITANDVAIIAALLTSGYEEIKKPEPPKVEEVKKTKKAKGV